MTKKKADIGKQVVITGAAGLVGQNLAALLASRDDLRLIGIDTHRENLTALARRCPTVEIIHADLAEPGEWEKAVSAADIVVQLHMQAKGTGPTLFERNNILATKRVLHRMARSASSYLVHVSSAAVHSMARDYYSSTKIRQEALVRSSGLRHCVLRPTLMYGPHDPKHLGWLARFMAKAPVFPVPGNGRFVRQPLYVVDFCRIIAACIDRQPENEVYDIVGYEQIDYIDMIREIRRVTALRTPIVHIPIPIFRALLRLCALFSEEPPFTADQLEAITVGDLFVGQDIRQLFGVVPTPFRRGIQETFSKESKQS
jgi:nucleoside-diphosphate-sugar epimerase